MDLNSLEGNIVSEENIWQCSPFLGKFKDNFWHTLVEEERFNFNSCSSRGG